MDGKEKCFNIGWEIGNEHPFYTEKGDVTLRENRGHLWRWCVAFVCLLVFLFALHARLELYGHGFNTRIHPCASSKWRIENTTTKIFIAAIVVWFAAAITYRLLFDGEPILQQVLNALIPHDVSLLYRERFLRPPPTFAC